MVKKIPLSEDELRRVSRIRQKIKAVIAQRDHKDPLKKPPGESLLSKHAERRSKLVYEFSVLDENGDAKSFHILTYNDILQIIREDFFVSHRTVNDDDLKLVFRALLDSSRYERPGLRLDYTGRMSRPPEAVLAEELVGFIEKGDSESKMNDEAKKALKLMRVRRNVKLGIQQHLQKIQREGLDTGERDEALSEEQLLKELFQKYDKDGGGELSMFEFTHAIRNDLQLNSWDISAEELRKMFRYIDEDGSGEISVEEVLAFLREKAETPMTQVSSNVNRKGYVAPPSTVRELLTLRLTCAHGPHVVGPVHPFTTVPRGKRATGRLAAAAATDGGASKGASKDPLLVLGKADKGKDTNKVEERKAASEAPGGRSRREEEAETSRGLLGMSSSLDRVNSIIEGLVNLGVHVGIPRLKRLLILLTMSTAVAAATLPSPHPATGDIDVTMDDQLRINRFSRLNQTYEELEEEVEQMKEKLRLCNSAVEEVELCMDDDGLMLSVGECFVPVDEDEALENVEAKKDALNVEMKKLTEKSDAIQEEMKDLKRVLYAKFGDTINLGLVLAVSMGCTESSPVTSEGVAELVDGGQRREAEVQCELIGYDGGEKVRQEWAAMAVEERRSLEAVLLGEWRKKALREVERTRLEQMRAIDAEMRERMKEMEEEIVRVKEGRMARLREEIREEEERMREDLNEWCAAERSARTSSMAEDFERLKAELDGELEAHKRRLKERMAALSDSQRRAIDLLLKGVLLSAEAIMQSPIMSAGGGGGLPHPSLFTMNAGASSPVTPSPTGMGAAGGGLTAMLLAMVDEDSRASSVNSSAGGSGAKRSSEARGFPALQELRKKIDAMDLDASRKKIFEHKLSSLRSLVGGSEKHIKECSDLAENAAVLVWEAFEEVLERLGRPNVVKGEPECLDAATAEDCTEELKGVLEVERELLKVNEELERELKAAMHGSIDLAQCSSVGAQRVAPAAAAVEGREDPEHPLVWEHFIDTSSRWHVGGRPVQHIMHDKDTPASREPSVGPQTGGRHKKQKKGHKEKGLPQPEAATDPPATVSMIQHQKHEHKRQVQQKHQHNHGHAYHPQDQHHHHGRGHHQVGKVHEARRRDEWETVEPGLVASASQKSLGASSYHGLNFEEASFKLSTVPKKHFMGEQSELEPTPAVAGDDEGGGVNRKIRRQRQQEQQRRDKSVRKQISNRARNSEAASAAGRRPSNRESFQAFDPFDIQFPAYMGQEDSRRVSTYSPWDPAFQSHAAFRPWLDDIQESGGDRRVGSKKNWSSVKGGRKGKSGSGVRRWRYVKTYEGQWGSYYPVSPWSDDWVRKTSRKGGRLRGLRATFKKARHFHTYSPFDERFAMACQVSFYEYDDPNEWFKSHSPWNNKFPHRFSSPKKNDNKSIARPHAIPRWHQIYSGSSQQTQQQALPSSMNLSQGTSQPIANFSQSQAMMRSGLMNSASATSIGSFNLFNLSTAGMSSDTSGGLPRQFSGPLPTNIIDAARSSNKTLVDATTSMSMANGGSYHMSSGFPIPGPQQGFMGNPGVDAGVVPRGPRYTPPTSEQQQKHRGHHAGQPHHPHHHGKRGQNPHGDGLPGNFQAMIDANDKRVIQQLENARTAQGLPQRQMSSFSTSAIYVDPEVIRAGLVRLPSYHGTDVPQPTSSAFPRFSPLARQQLPSQQSFVGSPLAQQAGMNTAPNPFAGTNLFGMPATGYTML
ncbi:Prefoldin subunit 4 [Perkinsus chesapeaki]|uniref:Prefoldin subunit 4 n=1 Tax=Perkinsus chesapeaki TaxID=330153 RepID=A0A7J6LLH5_PERCH|nr:Prefoldin subunit 4 [Perkinsus chesapeaki]